jgi:hypothetical protein
VGLVTLDAITYQTETDDYEQVEELQSRVSAMRPWTQAAAAQIA